MGSQFLAPWGEQALWCSILDLVRFPLHSRLAFALAVVLGGCATLAAPSLTQSASIDGVTPQVVVGPAIEPGLSTTTTTTVARTTTTIYRDGQPRPGWIGTGELPFVPGQADPGVTVAGVPEALEDRRFWSPEHLAPPPNDVFLSSVETPPPPNVVARSTWNPECPVALDDLGYAQVSFFGFDGLFHTGEFIAHADHIDGMVEIFALMHERRFPIEEMVVTSTSDLTAHPSGDINNTGAFVCRRTVGSTRWSQHAFGLAIDINPFHNPYIKGDTVIPHLAQAYLDRERDVPGMVNAEIVSMFADIGWEWGGNWRTARDWMHFSENGR